MNEISVIFTIYVLCLVKSDLLIYKCIIVMICDNLNVIFVPDPFKFILNYSNSS